ncbi:ATP-dependent nuclease [Burkholderia pseudomallei]|uniref:ATP-dependent nuclease n=1 Tax=Burkholderia pseudomallei TaxID=28450 RepID=UPI0021F7472B|nr:AAA family ATPase [Burkholderia pseudomallei]MCW0131871.1 AAA family ATPase [Burkholderia pseudomallei]
MYLHRISGENFRVFGTKDKDAHLDLEFAPGLNVLVGENDAGKTSVIDAIRHVLLTTSYEFLRIQEQDFHIEGSTRADALWLEAEFRGLSKEQRATVLEWLTYPKSGDPYLAVHVSAKFGRPIGRNRGNVVTSFVSGPGGTGIEIGSAVRDLIRATYLRPLRDAEAELRAGRQSRLSQILQAHRKIAGQEVDDFDRDDASKSPTTLVGFMQQAQHRISSSDVIKAVQEEVNDKHLARVSFSGDELSARIGISSRMSLLQILEKLELALLPPIGVSELEQCARGLGYNNVLFMSAELVLLSEGEELALLLIEEPEAHIHPQLQGRVLELFKEHADRPEQPVQVLISTHSPTLASAAPVESTILMVKGRTYALRKGLTKLQEEDYAYLQRFLDATKANLFFARSVVVVEGPAEAILLPTLAAQCGLSFSEHGVSVVNVGNVGLFRYARILQREDGEVLPLPVACITDRDIVPNHIDYAGPRPAKRRRFEDQFSTAETTDHVQRKKKRAEGGSTKVFVSDRWTLEYDMAVSGCAKLMHDAVALAVKAGDDGYLSEVEIKAELESAGKTWAGYLSSKTPAATIAANVYKPLFEKDASKAVTAQFCAYLLRTGEYGDGDALLDSLPAYLKEALLYVTRHRQSMVTAASASGSSANSGSGTGAA